LQSVEAIQIAYAQALLVDDKALDEARESNDVVRAQEILQQAFRTDVRSVVAHATPGIPHNFHARWSLPNDGNHWSFSCCHLCMLAFSLELETAATAF
jgi:hypothetical protein